MKRLIKNFLHLMFLGVILLHFLPTAAYAAAGNELIGDLRFVSVQSSSVEPENKFSDNFETGYNLNTDATPQLWSKWSYPDAGTSGSLQVQSIDGSNVLFMGKNEGNSQIGPLVQAGAFQGMADKTMQVSFRFKPYNNTNQQFKVTARDSGYTEFIFINSRTLNFCGIETSNAVNLDSWNQVRMIVDFKNNLGTLYVNNETTPLHDAIDISGFLTEKGLNTDEFGVRFGAWLWGSSMVGYYLDDVSIDLVSPLKEEALDITHIGLRSGDVKLEGEIQNTGSTPASYAAYTVLYSNDEISEIDVSRVSAVQPGSSAKLGGKVTVPEEYKNCFIRVFVWGADSLRPLSDVTELKPDTNYFPEDEPIEDEFDYLRTRWKNYLIGGREYYDVEDTDIKNKITEMDTNVTNLKNNMQTGSSRTYLWSDCAYSAAKKNPAALTGTFGNLKNMAIAYKTPTSSHYQSQSLKNAIIDGLDWAYANWFNENVTITNSTELGNWWEWEIGAPQELASTMALMYADLSATQLSNYNKALTHWCPDPVDRQLEWISGYKDAEEDGANRVWKCSYVIVQGIVMKDADRIEQGRNGLDKVFTYVDEIQDSPDYDPSDPLQKISDGFYSDGTFIQHGKVVYNAGYGASLMKNVADAMYILGDSDWDLTSAQKEMVYEWIINAYEPIIFKGAIMDSFRGTGISEYTVNDRSVGHEVIRYILQMSEFMPEENKNYIKSMVKYWVNSDKNNRNYFNDTSTLTDTFASVVSLKNLLSDDSVTERGALYKNKVYAEGDRVVHLMGDFGLSISMSSERIYRYSCLALQKNNESGWYTNAGMTTTYDKIMNKYEAPYWAVQDKSHLPGTTAERREHARQEGANTENDTDYAGGATLLDKYGSAGMQWVEYGGTTRIKKSWFMFDDEVVALGADLHSTAGVNIDTTIENRPTSWELPLVIDNVSIPTLTSGTGTSTDTVQSGVTSGADWAWFGVGVETGYYFPDTQNISWKREFRTGSWHSMNSYYSSTWTNQMKFLSMVIDHGVNPDSYGPAYSYVILPNRGKNEVASYSTNPDITVLSNNVAVQAVEEKTLGIVAANFFEASGVDGSIESSGEACVLTKRTGNVFDIAVSDPTHNNSAVTLTFAVNAENVVSKDERITIINLNPLKIAVDVSGARGATFAAQFEVN